MDDDSPRFFALSLSVAIACALAWLLMGGAEMVASMAERQGIAVRNDGETERSSSSVDQLIACSVCSGSSVVSS